MDTLEIPEFARDMIKISDYDDVVAVLRDTTVESIWSGDTGGRDPEFVRDGLVAIDGAEHRERRRLESQLFTAARLAEFERSTLARMLDGFFAECDAHRDQDGVVAVDLVHFGLSMLVRIGAAIAGLDGVDTVERSTRLLAYSDATSHAANVHWAKVTDAEKQRVMAHGRMMRDQFTEEFLRPSVQRRQELIQESRDGRRSIESLPRDVITLLLSHSREDWKDDLLVREVLIYLHASIRTSTRILCNAVEQLVTWLGDHPEDRSLVADADFLRSIVNETLRLRAVVPLLLRKTTVDVTLPGGRVIPGQQYLALLHTLANRDTERFGADSNEFNPRRQLTDTAVQGYGLAFAVGPHTCIGKRVAVGAPAARGSDEEPTTGTVPTIVGRLAAAGLELDPARPPVPNADSYYDEFLSFPVRLTKL